MKKLTIIAFSAMLLMVTTACHMGTQTTISTETDTLSQKIEYAGRVVFTQDQKAIESISKGGYLKFAKNGKKLQAENDDNGKLTYEFDGSSNIQTLSAEQKQFLAEAIKVVIKERAKLKAENN